MSGSPDLTASRISVRKRRELIQQLLPARPIRPVGRCVDLGVDPALEQRSFVFLQNVIQAMAIESVAIKRFLLWVW